MSARRRRLPLVLFGCAALAAWVCLAALAHARPGGGDSYGGGGGGGGGGDGGGGGGGGGADALIFIVELCFTYPVIGVPLLVVFVICAIWVAKSKSNQQKGGWTAGVADDSAQRARAEARAMARRSTGPSPAKKLEALRAVDPNFSLVLLEDFLYALYAEVHRARGAGELEALSAYVAPQAAASLLRNPGVTEVKGVVIGAMSIDAVDGVHQGASATTIQIGFESNYVEVTNGQELTYWVEEKWTLFRKLGVLSRTPERARNVACPKCGAPLQSSTLRGGTCSYCQTHVATGDFDWLVTAIRVENKVQRPPQLTTDVAEIGTDWPTVVDPDARQRFTELCARDPAFSWANFEQRVKTIHKELNEGWSSLDGMRVRPYVSDNLFQQQMYWIDAYKKSRLRNRLDGARVLAVETAKVGSDKFYDALTVRVHATGLDYTVNEAQGGIVRGSDTEERRYTEYWTLIRGTNTKGAARSDRVCPRCGAPLKINQFGSCEFCHAKVTTGDFDWVLSRIEQDEAYSG